MDIDLVWDSSVANAPSGFKPAMEAAASVLDSLIANNITVNINVGYGEYTEYTSSGTIAEALTGTESEGGVGAAELLTYPALLANSAATLPASDPTGGGYFVVANAQAKAWGLMANGGTEIDGSVGFGSGTGYDYSLNGNSVAPPGNELDFLGIAEHELSHALGRLAGLAQETVNGVGVYTAQDLFRYSAPGVLDLSQTTPGYFSVNGGVTDLANFATTGDLGDWNSSAVDDSFDSISMEGAINKITPADDAMMSALGFQVNPACFVAGTHIATLRGEVAVQSLWVGDIVRLADGGSAPVAWLGHRRIDCRRHPRPADVWPVRVQAGAFAPGRPARDLYLSPDHAVLVRGVLVPIRYLLNGASVAQVPKASVEYWHVELPAHAALLAEGLPAESYLDTGNRSAFVGEGPAVQLHPDFARSVWAERACAPLVLAGPRVAAIRRRLLARSTALGHAQTGDPCLSATADGRPLALAQDGARYVARLPRGAKWLRLRSRAWVPAHMETHATDTRALGVAVVRLSLDGRDVSLGDCALASGWHPPEDVWRWTDGDAVLRVAGAAEFVIEIAPMGRFWLADATGNKPVERDSPRYASSHG